MHHGALVERATSAPRAHQPPRAPRQPQARGETVLVEAVALPGARERGVALDSVSRAMRCGRKALEGDLRMLVLDRA